MTLNADKDVFAAIIRRKGGEGDRTKLWENLWPAARAHLTGRIILAADEEPFAAHVDHVDYWCVVTSQRVIWCDAGGISEIHILDIQSVGGEDLRDVRRRLPDVTNVTEMKLKRSVLSLGRVDGTIAAISFEPGQTYYAMLSAIGWLWHWAVARRQERGSQVEIGLESPK